MTWHGISFGKTHDLMILLAEIVQVAPDFDDARFVCAELAEFAVDVRYPGGISEPPEGEAERFISEAEKVLIRVERMINASDC